jgi:hypothetical protein
MFDFKDLSEVPLGFQSFVLAKNDNPSLIHCYPIWYLVFNVLKKFS